MSRRIRKPLLPSCILHADSLMVVQSDDTSHGVIESAGTIGRAARAARWLTEHERRNGRPTVYSVMTRADAQSVGLLS